jgi:hypothetical protein
MSQINAAMAVLKKARKPMNCKEFEKTRGLSPSFFNHVLELGPPCMEGESMVLEECVRKWRWPIAFSQMKM